MLNFTNERDELRTTTSKKKKILKGDEDVKICEGRKNPNLK